MGLKVVETKEKFPAAGALQPLRECAGRLHLDGRRKETESNPAGVHGRFENAFIYAQSWST